MLWSSSYTNKAGDKIKLLSWVQINVSDIPNYRRDASFQQGSNYKTVKKI